MVEKQMFVEFATQKKESWRVYGSLYPWGLDNVSFVSYVVPANFKIQILDRLYISCNDRLADGELSFLINGIIKATIDLKSWINFSDKIKKSFIEGSGQQNYIKETLVSYEHNTSKWDIHEHIAYPFESIKLYAGDCFGVQYIPYKPKKKQFGVVLNWNIEMV